MKELSAAYLYEKKGVDDLEDSMSASNADDVIDDLGYDGSGIPLAVWEGGADDKANLVIESEYDTTPTYKSSHTD